MAGRSLLQSIRNKLKDPGLRSRKAGVSKTKIGACSRDPEREAGKVAVQEGRKDTRARQLAAAMALMQRALAILDESNDADKISLHLHLAIERLRDLTGESARFDRMSGSNELD